MEALRKLDIEKIRKYHSQYYVPHNLCLVVSGRITTEALLGELQSSVEPVLSRHIQRHGGRLADWKRPFLETPSAIAPQIKGVRTVTVDFPSKNPGLGEFTLIRMGGSSNDALTLLVTSSNPL